MSGVIIFITTLSGLSLSAGSGMSNGGAAAIECRNRIFRATFPGIWPLKPIVLPGAFGEEQAAQKGKGKGKGQPDDTAAIPQTFEV